MTELKKLFLQKPYEIVAFLLWWGISLFIAPYHEPWADELQAWFIIQGSSWFELITTIPHQEGHPTLWHIILKIVSYFSNDINMSYISVFVMGITVYLILFKMQLPLLYRILIVFSYNFIYHYTIFARNYCLSYLALTILGIVYDKRFERPYTYVFTLIFLAFSSAFTAPISALLGLYFVYDAFKRKDKNCIFPIGILGFGGLLFLWMMLPINNIELAVRAYPSRFFQFIFDLSDYFVLLYNYSLFLKIFSILILLFYTLMFIAQIKLSLIKKNFRVIFIIFFFLFCFYYPYPRHHHFGIFLYGIFILLYIFNKNSILSAKYFVLYVLGLHLLFGISSSLYDWQFDLTPKKQIISILDKIDLSKLNVAQIGLQTIIFNDYLKERKVLKENLYYKFDKTIEQRISYWRNLLEEDPDVIILDATMSTAPILKHINPKLYYVYKFRNFLYINETFGQFFNIYIKKDVFAKS